MPQKKWPRPPKELMLCRICGEMKPEAAYAPSVWVSAITRSKCRECMSKYQAARYDRFLRDRLEADRKKRTQLVHSIKRRRGCAECGETHPACLDFHHRDKRQKTVGVGVLVGSTTNMQRILDEIAKCDVLCSNCHRKHHWKHKTAGRPRKVRV